MTEISGFNEKSETFSVEPGMYASWSQTKGLLLPTLGSCLKHLISICDQWHSTHRAPLVLNVQVSHLARQSQQAMWDGSNR
jgi:hypothetical protein